MRERDPLTIVHEEIVCTLPRGRDGREEMRVTRVWAKADDKDVSWISVGLFWQSDDGWRRSKNVATVRLGEASTVAEAIAKAAQLSAPTTNGHAPSEHRSSSDAARSPFGRSKGKLLADLDDDDLQWLADALERSISDPAKASYRVKNQRDLDAIQSEMRGRGLE